MASFRSKLGDLYYWKVECKKKKTVIEKKCTRDVCSIKRIVKQSPFIRIHEVWTSDASRITTPSDPGQVLQRLHSLCETTPSETNFEPFNWPDNKTVAQWSKVFFSDERNLSFCFESKREVSVSDDFTIFSQRAFFFFLLNSIVDHY